MHSNILCEKGGRGGGGGKYNIYTLETFLRYSERVYDGPKGLESGG